VRIFEVIPNPQNLTARGLSLKDLQAVLETNNRNDGAGRLADGEESLLVRAEGAIATVDDVKAIILQAKEGNVVRISDVADVRFGSLTRYGAGSKSGWPKSRQVSPRASPSKLFTTAAIWSNAPSAPLPRRCSKLLCWLCCCSSPFSATCERRWSSR
jgi:hypothetical protein